jgi:hypothetical protein
MTLKSQTPDLTITPQAPVAIGLVIFSIALVDVLLQTIHRRTPILADAEEI